MHFNEHTAAAVLLPVLAVMLVSSAQQTTNQFSTTAASVGAEKFTKKSTGKLHKLGEQYDTNNNSRSQNYNKKFSFMNEKSSKVSNVATVVNESETAITATTTTTTSLLNVINSQTEIAGKQDVISSKPSDALWLDDDLPPYEEFTLLEEIPPTQTTQATMLVADQQHIYKVPKPLLKMRDMVAAKSHGPMLNTIDSQTVPASGFQIANNTSQALGFQIMTALFDHSRWSNSDIERNVSANCAADMKIYLRHMRLGSEWALKVMDSSGRFGSEFLFGNDFWMGSKRFCGEVDRTLKQMNRENRYSNRNRRPQMGFFVARIAAKLEYMFAGPKLIQMGQCLPGTCSNEDVKAILQLDPAIGVLAQLVKDHNTATMSPTDQFDILDIRPVPGAYNLWMDRRFFILGTTIIVVVALVVVATCYEAHLQANGFDVTSTRRKPQRQRFRNEGGKATKDVELNQMNKVNNNVEEINGNDVKMDNEQQQADIQQQQKQQHGLEELKPIGICSKLILCFAAGSNGKAILSVEQSTEGSINCVHGLRLYSLLWTILVHTYLQVFTIGENRFHRKMSERTFIYQMIGNASFSVDTFFFLSGLLVVLIYMRSLKKSLVAAAATTATATNKNDTGNIFKTLWKIIAYVAYRFCRLTPVYLFIVIFAELSMKWTYNGSVFQPSLIEHITCHKFWWRNILYINNFYPYHEMCMVWSWYLANDMQFYIMAIVLLVFAARYFKSSVMTLAGLLLSSWAVSIYFSIHFNYTHKVAEPFESFDILYDKPWQRVGPYIMGMVAGYILHRFKSPPRVSCFLNLFLWLVSLGMLFALVFGTWNGVLSVPLTALYVSLGHTAWGLALIWITLSCCWGMAPPINGFLSYRGFFPLSRLTYCAYLLHPLIMMLTSFQMESPLHLHHAIILTLFFGNAVISFLASFVVSVMLEAPTIRLLKIIMNK